MYDRFRCPSQATRMADLKALTAKVRVGEKVFEFPEPERISMYPSQLEPAAYVGQLAEASLRLVPHLTAGEKIGRRIVNHAMEEATGCTSASESGLNGTVSRCWKWLCSAGWPGN
jgi:hypothetical protein